MSASSATPIHGLNPPLSTRGRGADGVLLRAVGHLGEVASLARFLHRHADQKPTRDASRRHSDMRQSGFSLRVVAGCHDATKHRMSALALRIEHEARELVPRALANEPAKIIALRVGSTPRTAKAWKLGEHLPQAHHMMMLARVYPEIGAAVRVWLDMHLNEETGEAERLLRDVQGYLTRRGG